MRSEPTLRRTILAAILMGTGAALVFVVKFTRGSSSLPTELTGVFPNLVCAIVTPLAVFLGPKTLSARDFLLFDLLILIGLCGYEAAQIWMPRRTFDWFDIAASSVGAVAAIALGFALFLRPAKGLPAARE